MRMLTKSELAMLNAFAKLYFQIVPVEYRTYCSLTTAISREVLQQLGIKSTALPCQLWCAAADHNYAIGFLRQPEHTSKWDGHVVCSTGGWILDASLHQLKRDFEIEVPSVAVVSKFAVQTQVIARLDLDRQKTLWWHSPPLGVNIHIPKEPKELIFEYSKRLVQELKSHQSGLP